MTVCGAGCTLGETVSLLLKQSPFIGKMDLYDTKQNITGHILDLSAIETTCKVRGFVGLKCLPTALAVCIQNSVSIVSVFCIEIFFSVLHLNI